MAQITGPGLDWIPWAHTFIDAAASTAIALPARPSTAQTTSPTSAVAVLTAQTQGQWIRLDGAAVTAAVTGGLLMNAGDFSIIYGLQNISAVRFIHNLGGGSLSIALYLIPSPTT